MRVPEIVGYRLREARDGLKWSQAEFAEHLEGFLGRRWFPQTVSAAEKGARDFTAEEIYCIASALDRPVRFFFDPPIDSDTVELPGQTLKASDQPKWGDDAEARLRVRRILQQIDKQLEGTAASASGAEGTLSDERDDEEAG